MNAATRYVDSDALGALRAELVAAGRRATGRRRRRRRAATLLAAAVAVLALAAGAAAVAGLGTGVAPVDELLQIERGDESGRPVALDASAPLPMDLGRAGKYQLVAFLDRHGYICTASAEPRGDGVRGGFGCVDSIAGVSRRLERRGGLWAGGSSGPNSRVHKFLVAGEVTSLRPLDEGEWTVRMTPAWTPEARGARPMRLVLVIDDADIEDPDAFIQPSLELTYEDGSKRVLRGPQAK